MCAGWDFDDIETDLRAIVHQMHHSFIPTFVQNIKSLLQINTEELLFSTYLRAVRTYKSEWW